jgi:hypothetical protein
MNIRNIINWFICLMFFSGCQEKVVNENKVNVLPTIYPDYIEVTIPSSIAPLNFSIRDEKFELIDVLVKGKGNKSLHVQGKSDIQFPIKKWKKLLSENKDSSLQFIVSIKQNGNWKTFKPFDIYINSDSIDYGLVYRLIAPGYEVYSKMGIYERNLSNFVQKPIVENTLITGSCLNCHAFNQNNPSFMSLHVRGNNGATMLKINNDMQMFITKTDSTISSCVYPYWHPSGNYIAYSVNITNQAFHAVKDERVEVVDKASDIVVYDVKSNKLISTNLLKTDDLETFPAFSPDGKTLYFCLAKKMDLQNDYKKVKYSLCKISFDPSIGKFGNKIDTLVSANDTKKSVSFPRPSFDGKFLMFTLSDYGNFSIWHKEADLYLFNLANGTFHPIDQVNSKNTESYHDWSSNSKWFVFSSRRDDGLYTRLYISHIDQDGNATKPFMLPQKKADFYDNYLFSYNVPEFTQEPIKLNLMEFKNKIMNGKKKKMLYERNN